MGAYFLYSSSALAPCPDDFATSEESTAAMNAWTNSYFDTHLDASMGDWARARRQFYVDNHCIAALERVQQAEDGKADPETMNIINDVLRDEIDAYTP